MTTLTHSPIVGPLVIVVTEGPGGHFSARSFGSPAGSRAPEDYCDRLAQLAHAISTMSAEEVEIASGTSVVDVPRLRAIEAAAREVLARGQARYDVDPLGASDASDCPVGDPGCDAPDDGEWHSHDACEARWIGDLVPAAAMQALRVAVDGDGERAK